MPSYNPSTSYTAQAPAPHHSASVAFGGVADALNPKVAFFPQPAIPLFQQGQQVDMPLSPLSESSDDGYDSPGALVLRFIVFSPCLTHRFPFSSVRGLPFAAVRAQQHPCLAACTLIRCAAHLRALHQNRAESRAQVVQVARQQALRPSRHSPDCLRRCGYRDCDPRHRRRRRKHHQHRHLHQG